MASYRAALRMAFFACCLGALASASAQQIALMPKSARSVFWRLYISGAEKAAQELGVELVERSPAVESHVDAQIKMVDYFVAKGFDAIVLTPLDRQRLVGPAQRAVDAGLAVVVTDSALDSDLPAAFIASDNRRAGELGAAALAKELGGEASGRLLNLRYLEGSASTDAREIAAAETFAALLPGAEVEGLWGGVVLGDAKRAVEERIDAGADFIGVLTTNTLSTSAAYKALKAKALAGRIPFWGSGVNDELLAALRAGEISGLYVQDPYRMGYLGVQAACAKLKGEPVERRIVVDVAQLTRENMDSPEVQKLVKP